MFEFPVTIEDEELPKLGDRVSQAIELAHQIGRYGGCVVVLIHPNILDHKLEFEKRFVEGVKSVSWFGSLSEFGQWWAARNQVTVDVVQQGSSYTLTLAVPIPMTGLNLQVPSTWRLDADHAAPTVTQRGRTLILSEARGCSHASVFLLQAEHLNPARENTHSDREATVQAIENLRINHEASQRKPLNKLPCNDATMRSPRQPRSAAEIRIRYLENMGTSGVYASTRGRN